MTGKLKIIAVVLILLTLGAIWFFASIAADIKREEKIALFNSHLKLLSAQARTLVSKSAIVELQGLLNNFVAAEEDIDFCFIVSGGRPYLHTFESGFPTDFPVIEAELSEGTSSTPVQLDDQEYTVLSTLMGFGSSSIHLGVKRKLVTPGLLDYSLLPFLIPLAVIALAVLMLVFFSVGSGKTGVVSRDYTRAPREMNVNVSSDELSTNAPCGLLLVDPVRDTVRFANNHAARMIKGSVKSLLGQELAEILYASDPVNLENAQGNKPGGTRGSLFTSGGGKIPVFINTSLLKVKSEELIIVSLVDLSSQRQLEERYKKAYAQQESLANHDKLTDLFNRRALAKHAEAELNRAERGEDLSVIILDIDHFKNVNDTYGHNVGDIVLQAVSSCLKQMVRPYDWLGRWGGEEFIIILPGTGLNTAALVADRIREKIEHTKVRLKGYEPLGVTVSFGVVSTIRSSGNSFIFDNLVEHADKALYNSKSKGRNRVSVYINGQCKVASFNTRTDEEDQKPE